MYIHTMMNRRNADTVMVAKGLLPLPCACQSLRRITRLVTRIYDQELRMAGIEITQFGILTSIEILGEANQKTLSAGFAMDSTTLTRTLAILRKRDWISVRPGKDRRERVFSLTEAGRRQITAARPQWQEAERRLRKSLGERVWRQMQSTVSEITLAAAEP